MVLSWRHWSPSGSQCCVARSEQIFSISEASEPSESIASLPMAQWPDNMVLGDTGYPQSHIVVSEILRNMGHNDVLLQSVQETNAQWGKLGGQGDISPIFSVSLSVQYMLI